ncbi:hypothetical protein LUCX_168 [Xanthomonas phage vB_XciM_LucasX]|nr:hypothetical protein LUCX_168 [Xanthomonas phage vB_XciM_LucasX]
MRYNVGDTSLFIFLDFTPAHWRFGNLYIPWQDTLNEMIILEAACIEHHRVAGEWDDEIQYDGFIFQDTQGQRWHNQYPRAAYGQLDDSNDHRIHRAIGEEECAQVKDDRAASAVMLRNYEDVREFLRRIIRTENPDYAKELEQSHLQALQDHYAQVVKAIEEKGYSVKRKTHIFRYTNGRPDEEAPPYFDRVVITKNS